MKRKCSKCGKQKPKEAYNKLPRGKDGLRAQCKECDRKYRNKRKQPPMPKEGEEYRIDSTTVRNHFYLHFGFTERRYNHTEGYDMTKYEIPLILITKYNNK